MPKVYFGCETIPKNWDNYTETCNAVELNLNKLKTHPNKATLNQWRVETPSGFGFMLHANQRVQKGLLDAADRGETELSDQIRRGWESTLDDAEQLAAAAIVIPLGNDFQPNENNRQLLKGVGEQLAGETDRVVIIDTQGPWPVERTRDELNDVGLTYAFDPFLANRDEMEFTHGDTAFVLTERAGMRRQFNLRDIRTMLSWVTNYDRVFTMLRGRFHWPHAKLLSEALDY